MAVFTDVFFPECLSYGSEFKPTYETLKVDMLSGAEQRSSRTPYVKNKYSIDIQYMRTDEIKDVLSIFHVCSGDLHGFLFKDPTDFASRVGDTWVSEDAITMLDQPLGIYDAGTTFYELTKRYAIASRSKLRRIRYPDTSTLVVAANGTLVADATWDAAEQAVTFPTPPAADAVLTAGFRFWVPVRFDKGEFPLEPAAGYGETIVGSLRSISLVEIFE